MFLKRVLQTASRFGTTRALVSALPRNIPAVYFSAGEQKPPAGDNKIKIDLEDSDADFKPKPKVKAQPAADEDTFKQIDKWVKENKVVLFMKGSPQMPMCGYSNFAVELLKFYKIKDYYSVDILANQTLREQVKLYSNWPTYPQLYIDGKLIGGSDILNEMHKEGTLKEMFVQAGLPSQ